MSAEQWAGKTLKDVKFNIIKNRHYKVLVLGGQCFFVRMPAVKTIH